jgi:putative phosphoribosyl transferase
MDSTTQTHAERIQTDGRSHDVTIEAGDARLEGEVTVPASAPGIVLFAHGSGSGRTSPRNRFVASVLHRCGMGTLLFDLLTPEEQERDRETRALRFDIDLLAGRLVGAAKWLATQPVQTGRRVGFYGSSTGAAAALIAAAELGEHAGAVVSRGGRPDLAGPALGRVQCPTLLIVGALDVGVIGLNRAAYEQLACVKDFRLVPGATHLFEERGAIDEVARLSARWFADFLQ